MTFPTDFMPDSPKPASFKLDRMVNVLRSVPVTGAHKAQTRQIGEGYWECDLDYNPMKEEHFGPLVSYLNQKNGMHDSFGVLVPNFDRRGDVTAAGNYISLSNGKCVQIQSPSSLAAPSDIFVASTNPNTTMTFSNGLALTSGVPVAVYFEASSIVSTATVELFTSNTGTIGSNASSETYNVKEGRNFFCLTPTQSGALYVKITHGTTASFTGWQIHEGLQVGIQTAATAPDVQASDAGAYYLPGPVAAMPVSLDSNKFSVMYGKDSFIKMKIGLIERR